MKLYKHQQRFIDKNPDCALLVWETGTGKTYAACAWLALRSKKRALIVCPKAIVGKWKDDLKEWKLKADVITRDEIKKHNLDPYGAIVIDEAQDFAAALFDKGRSQRATVLYNKIKKHPGTHMLLLTATPIRSTPWNIHTLATYIGHYWDKNKFQNTFFYLTDRYGRYHFEKKAGWQRMIRPYVEQIADIVLMKDCIDVPTQHHKVITIPWTKDQEQLMAESYAEPVAQWHERHRLEQGDKKFKELETIMDGYRKVIVVCHYLSQIEDYAARIKDREVFVLTGSTKDQHATIEAAKAADDCVFIIQASMGAGFDAAEFSVVVFASMDFKYISMVQMKGRVKRINNLHENTFYYLLGGKCDQAVYSSLMKSQDFDPHVYLAKNGHSDKEVGGE